MTACTKTITPADAGSLQSIVAALPDGAVLCMEAGVYQPVHLFIERSLTLRGQGEVVLDGKYRASTIEVTKPVDVVLEQLTLRNGSGGGMGGGGNLFISDGKSVTLRQVILENGEADANGGGAVFARAGVVVLDHCTLRKNHGRKAHSILLQAPAQVTLRECDLDAIDARAPVVAVSGKGQLTIESSRIPGELRADAGANVQVKGSRLGKPLPPGITDAGNNRFE